MERRRVLGLIGAWMAVGGGCLEPTVEERPTGEIDVTFRTEADRSYLLRGRLLDGDGELVDEFESDFSPGQEGGPSFYAGGLSNGPYTFELETDADHVRIEWSIDKCGRLDVTVTVLPNGQLTVVRDCHAA